MKQLRLGCMLIVLAALLGGCSGTTGSTGGNSNEAMPMALQGVVHGGQAPIVGSAVTLRAASEQGLSDAKAVATATTDSNGAFNFNFTCPSPASQMYLTSTGGNPGGGANSAIHLMSILGPCGSLHGTAAVNELTTVAAVYTLNGFIGPSGCSDCSGGLPASVDNITGHAPGLPNAMGNAALLVSSTTGQDAATLPTSAECPASGTVPANCLTVRKLNTAANALAACVNSAGPTSAQCVQLFDCATAGAVFTSSTACTPSGTLPTDTLQAMLNIVRNPATISAAGIDDTSNRDVVFSPAYTSPNHFTDYTMSLNLSAGGFDEPENVAVDSAGDIWVTNYNNFSVTELSPNGVPLSGASGFDTGQYPMGIAFDTSGNAWISDFGNNNLTAVDPTGTPIPGSPFSGGGLSFVNGVAASPDGDVWVTDFLSNGLVSRFTAAGSAVGSGYSTGKQPTGVAVDAAGYVFVANYGDSTVTEFSPAGTLVNTITNANLASPEGTAIDSNGNLWVASIADPIVSKITLANDSEIAAASFTGGGLSSPGGVATDAAGNVWVTNVFSSSVAEFSTAGVAMSPSAGFVGAGIDGGGTEFTPAVDPSGNLWIANYGNNSVTVFFGAAEPTRTPLVAAVSQGFVP